MTSRIGTISYSMLHEMNEFSDILKSTLSVLENPFNRNSFPIYFNSVLIPLKIKEKKENQRICDIYGIDTSNHDYDLPFTFLEEQRMLHLISNIKRKYLIPDHVKALKKSNTDKPDLKELITSLLNKDFHAQRIIATTPTGNIVLYSDKDNKKYVFKPTANNKEILAHEIFNHPNIIRCFAIMKNLGVYIEKADDSMENDLKKRQPSEKLKKIKEYIFEIANALNEMHNKGYVHLDVKEQNILICNGIAKLADFGLTEEIGYRLKAQGTTFYMAPEIVRQQGAYPKSDVWSLGIVLFHLLTGEYTEDTNKDHIAFMRCIAIMPPNLVPLDSLPDNKYFNDAKNLLRLMLKKNPDERITMEKVLNHPFFKN